MIFLPKEFFGNICLDPEVDRCRHRHHRGEIGGAQADGVTRRETLSLNGAITDK